MTDMDNIEYINALAPYDHGVWSGKNLNNQLIELGKNALFSDRSVWLLDKITKLLISKFSKEQLSKMCVLEVGCYDGWVLTNICNKIKFKEAIGVEPRLKNIKKGEIGRNLASVKTDCSFLQGSVEDLKTIFQDKSFDIVISLGMLHHVSSTYDAIKNLCDKSKNLIFIDTMIIPELTDDKEKIEPYVNTKDIIYQNEPPEWSIASFKFESPYGDGSTKEFGIVNVPSKKLLDMSLKISGFNDPETIGTEQDHFSLSSQNLRGVKEVLCFAQKKNKYTDLNNLWKTKVFDSETIFCNLILPQKLILQMSHSKILAKTEVHKDILKVVNQQKDLFNPEVIENLFLQVPEKKLMLDLYDGLNDEHFTILNLLFRSPFDKSLFEISKFFLHINKPELSIKYLKQIINIPGCDWWSFYRSCYVLKKCYTNIGDEINKKKYNDLLYISNENFPFKE